MKRILIVKVTSMGDIVQAMPVVADIQRAFPGAQVDWAADENFADILRWNTGVTRVLSAPLRRFKKARGWADLKAIGASIAELRAVRYDAVLDIHGVYKSAIIARLARSKRRFGYRQKDLGERGAAFAYTARFGPRPPCDAWHGMRINAGEALGYAVDGPPQFNLRIPRDAHDAPALTPPPEAGGAPVALLFHATSKDEKKWPVASWGELGRELASRGLRVELPWGSDAEREAAVAIAALVPGATVLPRQSVVELARRIETAALVVGMDTGLVHLAHALLRPTVMIFTVTSAEHYGVNAPQRSVSVGDGTYVPSVAELIGAVNRVSPPPSAEAEAQIQA